MLHRFAVAPLVLSPALALAEPAPHVEPDHGDRSRIEVSLGLMTPLGEAGVEYTQHLVPRLEIGFGLGAGHSGVQGAVMPRLRAGAGGVAFTIGAGVSAGPYREYNLVNLGFSTEDPPKHDFVLWANAELGFQLTSKDGVQLRVYGGGGRAMTDSGCARGGCDSMIGDLLPYGGVAIGHTL